MTTNKFLPIFWNLKEQKVLIVGGGRVGLQKIQSLISTQCHLHVVALEFQPPTVDFLKTHAISYSRRAYETRDLDGAAVVFAATQDKKLNQRICEEARQRKILINVVDDPALCDFYSAAVVERGPLQIAISTSGGFPALSRAFRILLDRVIPNSLSEKIEELSRARSAIMAETGDGEVRLRRIRSLARDFENKELKPIFIADSGG